jgi:putative SOS response-associated peptidase YedK
MCNLYSMTKAPEAVLRLFRVGHNRAAAIETKDAIFPGHMAPVVRLGGDGERDLVQMSWGFVLPQAGRAPRRVTNVRDDKARGSPFWRESFETRRCLVPVTSFAEPHEVSPATWHWFALRGDGPRPLFAFAGIWRHWRGPVRKDGPVLDLDVFSFMTTTPNALVATINHERMPVVLATDEAREQWLTGTPDTAFALAGEYPPDGMEIVQGGYEKRDLLGRRSEPGDSGTSGPALLL